MELIIKKTEVDLLSIKSLLLKKICIIFILFLQNNFLVFKTMKEIQKNYFSITAFEKFKRLSCKKKLKKIGIKTFKGLLYSSLAHTTCCALDRYAERIFINIQLKDNRILQHIFDLLMHIPYQLAFIPIVHIVNSPRAILKKDPNLCFGADDGYFFSDHYICPSYTYMHKFCIFLSNRKKNKNNTQANKY